MNVEIDTTKSANHYVNIPDDSKVVQLYLRRHKDTIVSEYTNLVPELTQKLNDDIYDNQLTHEHLQIPNYTLNFDAPKYIYNLIHDEDIRMGTSNSK